MAYEAQFRSNKTNVRSRKASAVFSVASDEKNNLGVLFGVECLFCLIGKGQYLACLVKCVGAKCTKRSCRVQQWSAQRCGFVFEVCGARFFPHSSLLTPHLLLLPLCALSNSALCTLHIGPRLVNILSDIEIQIENAKCKMKGLRRIISFARNYKAVYPSLCKVWIFDLSSLFFYGNL